MEVQLGSTLVMLDGVEIGDQWENSVFDEGSMKTTQIQQFGSKCTDEENSQQWERKQGLQKHRQGE